MSLRNRINGMSSGASQAFKAIKSSQVSNKGGEFDYLGSNFLALKGRVQDALLTQVMDPEKLSREDFCCFVDFCEGHLFPVSNPLKQEFEGALV